MVLFSCKEEEDLKIQPRWILLLLVMGFLHILRLSLGLLKWVYAYFLRPPKNLKNYGSWAVITGSTDGIGRAFAFQLASKGLNLVLVGRNPNKLMSVSQAISGVFLGVHIETVVLDFSGDLVEGVGRLMEVIGGLDVGVLVNNAGDGSPYAMYFDEMEEEAWKNMIKVNVEGLTRVTQAVLPGMLERKKGAIVNIGSGSTVVIPCHPLYTVYAATKSYIEKFSRSLHVEYKNSGIHVQCQVPLFVATKMAAIKRPSFFVPTPNDYAISALRWIGYEPLCTPYWTHSLQWFIASLSPHFVIDAWRLRWSIRQRNWCISHGKIKSRDDKQS